MSDLKPSLTALPQPLFRFSFSLFAKLPAELQLEILSHCQQNDLVCLSLSSHSLRSLTLPLIPAKPWLSSYDQTHHPDAIQCTCGNDSMTGVRQDNSSHRRKRHSYEYSNKAIPRGPPGCTDWSPCRPYPADHAVCRQRWCRHCTCTTCPLYARLRGWMGDQKYCSKCARFTRRPRTKKYNGRCKCPCSSACVSAD